MVTPLLQRLKGRMPVIADGWRRGQGTPMVWQPMPSILQQRLMLLLVFPQLIEVQAEYHRKSLTLLQAVLPQIKAQQGECLPGAGRAGSVGSLPFGALCLARLLLPYRAAFT